MLPACYYTQPPQLKTSHLGKFALETLFYIFHQMPADVLQWYVWTELYVRQWRYHEKLQVWFDFTTIIASGKLDLTKMGDREFLTHSKQKSYEYLIRLQTEMEDLRAQKLEWLT